jgi:hypothetical protein
LSLSSLAHICTFAGLDRGGRPPVDRRIAALIGHMVRETPGWGYKRYAERWIMPSGRPEIGVCPVQG